MNRAEMRDRTRQLAGAELDGLRSAEEVDQLIEEAYRQIGQFEQWKWREDLAQFETEADEPDYEVPSDIDEILGLTVLDAPGSGRPVPLREATMQDLLTQVRRDDSDQPRHYARFGDGKLRLAPTPNGEYVVEVFGLKPLSGLDSDSDEPEWDSRFHAIICYLAAAVLLGEEGQDELAESRRVVAEERLGEMVQHYQVSKDTSPVVMGGGNRRQPEARPGRLWAWR